MNLQKKYKSNQRPSVYGYETADSRLMEKHRRDATCSQKHRLRNTGQLRLPVNVPNTWLQ